MNSDTMKPEIKELLTEHSFKFFRELIGELDPYTDVSEAVLASVSQERMKDVINAVHTLALYLYFGASYFVNISPVAEDIAKALNISVEGLMKLSQMPEWKKSVESFGWRGNPTPQKERLSEIDPLPLQEKYLILKAFQREPESRVRFETYNGAIKVRAKYIDRYHFVFHDAEGNEKTLEKLNVVLAFPEDRMPYVKKGIKRRQSVAALGLIPIKKASERPKVDTAAPLGAIVECVMRNGLVVLGEKVWDSRYYIVMRVGGRKGKGGKIIIVYKHALLEFGVIRASKKRKKSSRSDWESE